MKPNLQAILIFLFLLPSFFSDAEHIIGGEMTYRCLGGGDYEITINIYRDCQGGGAGFDGPNNGAISIFKGDSDIEFDRIIMPLPTITDVPPISFNPCLVIPPNICVEQGIYKFNLSDPAVGNINLPISTESYFIVYQRCCRNVTISNIISPGETGATFFQEIKPEAQTLCNSTPTYDELTPIVLCVNEPFTFDHSATDIDDDELVYEFCSPLKGGGTAGFTTPGIASDLDGTNPNPDAPPPFENVTFITPPFSTFNPMGGDPMITIDEFSGILSGTPNISGQFVVGVCVTEFRNGSELSVVQRDFHFNVQACSPINIAADFIVTPDSNGLFHFQNNSINASSYLWDFGDGTTSDLKDPSHTYATGGSYTITLTVTEDMCDLTAQSTQTIVFDLTNVNDLENDFEVQIFPNPNQGDFNLKIKNTSQEKFQIEILNLNGKELFSLSENIPEGDFLAPINLNTLPQGVYYLKIKNSSKLMIKRLVIQ